MDKSNLFSRKLPWDKLWLRIWSSIQEPFTDDRLLVALDDFIFPMKFNANICGLSASISLVEIKYAIVQNPLKKAK